MAIGRVGQIVVSGAVEVALRYECAGRAKVAAQTAIDEYLKTPEYQRLCEARIEAETEWREAGDAFYAARP